MHQEDDNDDDDDYDDSQDNLDSPYKHYFKFDPQVVSCEQLLLQYWIEPILPVFGE